jgi:hypothetical protein
MKPRRGIVWGLFFLALVDVADAAVYCANSPAELVTILAAAQANGSEDEVRIAAGSYSLTVGPAYSANEGYAIEVSGGWNAACTSPRSGTTTLNGQNLVRALAVIQNSNATAATISVHDLTLVNGFTTGSTSNTQNGGALYVYGRNGAVTIERNVMYGSRADNNGGGLNVLTLGPLLVRNNLVFANTAGSIGGVWAGTSDPNFYITGNTIVANTALQNGNVGGLYAYLSGLGNAWLGNNIVWNNTSNSAFDLVVTGSNVRLHNDIGTASGSAPDLLSQGNLSIDPQFAPCSGFLCFNYRLKGSSPLIDAGYDGPPGGIGSDDLDLVDRIMGAHVDIGAYELDRIFADGFE